jgi:hypothetical protein
MEINLISDTVTKTNEMLQYMFNAEVEMMSIGKTQQLYKESRAIRYGSRSVFSVWNNGKSNGYKSKYTGEVNRRQVCTCLSL